MTAQLKRKITSKLYMTHKIGEGERTADKKIAELQEVMKSFKGQQGEDGMWLATEYDIPCDSEKACIKALQAAGFSVYKL